MTLVCACTHTHTHAHKSAPTCVCAPFPTLPCLAPPRRGGWVSWRNIPSREQLVKDLTRRFYIQLTACNIPFKKKYYLFACLKRHKDNIHVYDPDRLWSRGREIVQTALLSSTPGTLAREQSCRLGGEAQIPRPLANAVGSPTG